MRKLTKIALIVLGALAVLVLGFVAVVARQPADYHITRSATMAVSAAEVFEQVNDFHKWNDWSPWAKLDPDAKYGFEGSPAGEGAVFRWSGNDQVGEGQMTILESRPPELVRYRLEFIRPMQDSCETAFVLAAEGSGTRVTWSMSGTNGFVGKAICMFMDMDKLVGSDFERGLASMTSIVEAQQVETAQPDSENATPAGIATPTS